MKKKKEKPKLSRLERPIFDAIRKPAAPPGHALGGNKPEERAHPAGRTVKHKNRSPQGSDGD